MLDPSLAVAKYRRSAAGSSSHTKTRNRQPLQATLDHLLRIAATRQASPHHPPTSMIPWAEFCVDRLRACQADATRLENDPHPVPPSWHAKLARILIWIRYWTLELRGGDAWMPQTIQKLLSTALEKYWIAKENERTTETTTTTVVEEEDEILSFSALLRMSQQPLPNRFYQSILLDYSKHVVVDKEKPLSSNNYPLFHLALQLASHLVREEYYVVWKQPPHTKCHFSILQKCCLAPSLPLWRYRTVQHFNSSFAKHEAVADMPRLLKQSPPLDHHQLNNFDSFGLPVETREDGNNETTTVLILKSVAMKDDDPLYTTPRRDDAWVFGASSSNDDVDVVISDDNNNQDDMRRGDDQLAPLMGLSSERICQLLERPKQT